jgi:nicotinamide riboside transporter PnuC
MKKALSILTSRRFLLILTAIGITTTYCIFPSPFYLVLPLYISLFVGMLTSKANRYAFLIGGLNSILYTITYISFGTYMQAFYAFFFSCLLQLATFFTWSKRAYKNSTIFRRMTKKMYIGIGSSFVAIYCGAIVVLTLLGSKFIYLDTFTSLLSILVTILHLFSFREAPFLHAASSIIGLSLTSALVAEDPSRWPFMISGIYGVICVWRSIFAIWKLYKEQQTEKKETPSEQTASV